MKVDFSEMGTTSLNCLDHTEASNGSLSNCKPNHFYMSLLPFLEGLLEGVEGVKNLFVL